MIYRKERFGLRMLRCPRSATLLLSVALVAQAACQRPGVLATAPCLQVDGALATSVRADSLAGDYALTLVATQGPQSGRSAVGEIHLHRYTGQLASPLARPGGTTIYPLYGGVAVQLAEVGAQAPGDIASANPEAPGVLAMEWTRTDGQTPARVLSLRLGVEANRVGPARFDGASMVLYPTSHEAGRFSGRWESTLSGQQTIGYFCADRLDIR